MRVNKKIGLCILSSMAISTNLNAQVGKDSVLLEEVQVVEKNKAVRRPHLWLKMHVWLGKCALDSIDWTIF